MNSELYKEVLSQLDEQSSFLNTNFPKFGSSFYYVDSRLSVFADEKYWGILIEEQGLLRAATGASRWCRS